MSKHGKLISFHLNVLAEHGIISSEYGLQNAPSIDKEGRPIVVSYIELTEKGKDVISRLNL